MVAQLAVEVRDLVKVYPRPGGGTLQAVDGISFAVRAGEFFGFLGPNGAGKTTTLEIIEGVRRPTAGEVRVLGVDTRRALDRVKQLIGVQLQATSYFSLLTLEELLALFGSFYPRRRPPEELLATVGLTERRKAYVRQLSGGQQRRFSVAAALVNDPAVLFLDEPTTGLDPQMRHGLWDLLRRLNRDEGKTIVLTTHYIEEAELLADRWPSSTTAGSWRSTPRAASSAGSTATATSSSPPHTGSTLPRSRACPGSPPPRPAVTASSPHQPLRPPTGLRSASRGPPSGPCWTGPTAKAPSCEDSRSSRAAWRTSSSSSPAASCAIE